MNYARAIRTIRAREGLTQTQLAERIQASRSYISKIEKGEKVPSLEVVEKISASFNVPVHLFMLLATDASDEHGTGLNERYLSEFSTSLLQILTDSRDFPGAADAAK